MSRDMSDGVLIAVFRLLGVCHDFLYGDYMSDE